MLTTRFSAVLLCSDIEMLMLRECYKNGLGLDKEKINISKLENGHFNDEELEKINSLLKEFKTDEYEEVSIKSFDNKILNARYYEYEKGAPLQIMFHGYRSTGVRDFNLLDSAIETPYQVFGGEELYPTIQTKGTRLGYGLIKNHCMLDGNKRIGTHTMFVFFALNGIELQYTQKELYEMINPQVN